MVLVDTASDGRPRALEHQNAFNVVTFQFLQYGGQSPDPHNKFDLHTFPVTGSKMAGSIPKKGTVAEPGLVSIAPGKGVTTIDPVSVCLLDKKGYQNQYRSMKTGNVPERIDYRALLPTYMLIVPVPRLGIDRLADTAEHPQTTQIMSFDMLRPKTAQKTDSSRRRVELSKLIFVDGLPVTGGRRIDRGRFEDGGRHAVGKRSVDDVAKHAGLKAAQMADVGRLTCAL